MSQNVNSEVYQLLEGNTEDKFVILRWIKIIDRTQKALRIKEKVTSGTHQNLKISSLHRTSLRE